MYLSTHFFIIFFLFHIFDIQHMPVSSLLLYQSCQMMLYHPQFMLMICLCRCSATRTLSEEKCLILMVSIQSYHDSLNAINYIMFTEKKGLDLINENNDDFF